MTLVVGIGNPDRGDDGAGPEVAARVAALDLPGVRVVRSAEPIRLLDLWDGESDVVVVDAVRVDPGRDERPRADSVLVDEPGPVLVLDVDAHPLPAWAGSGGTHGFGVAAAVELARALGRLPSRLTVVGVACRQFGHGAGLSTDVAAAVEEAVAVVGARLSGYARPSS